MLATDPEREHTTWIGVHDLDISCHHLFIILGKG